MREFTLEFQDRVIEGVLKKESFELIFQWLEGKLNQEECASLEEVFVKWLKSNPHAYHLFINEYKRFYR